MRVDLHQIRRRCLAAYSTKAGSTFLCRRKGARWLKADSRRSGVFMFLVGAVFSHAGNRPNEWYKHQLSTPTAPWSQTALDLRSQVVNGAQRLRRPGVATAGAATR
jgi:hypothetical protein